MQQGLKSPDLEAVYPYTRPYSLPTRQTEPPIPSEPAISSSTNHATTRLSSASLPLPSHTPYSALPKVEDILEQDSAGPSSPKKTPLLFASSAPLNLDDFNLNQIPSCTTNRTDPLADISRSSAMRAGASPRPASAANSDITYPPPEAPMVLSPPSIDSRPRQPHEMFLPRPVPVDRHWIAVETFEHEYHLLISLPGFSREDITLTTKKGRILLIVADSWAPEGGHYERRVSFGYDADLTHIRADFDGDTMKIIIPRRESRASYQADQDSCKSR